MILHRFQPINKYTLINLKLQKNWAADPMSFNDPFEFIMRGEHFLDEKNKIQYLDAEKLKARKEILNRIRTFGVVSYTTDLDNEFMKRKERNKLFWSHYANSHKGMCLVFEADNNPFQLFKVKYQEELADYNFDAIPLIQGLGPYELVCTKATEWKYESEYREIFIRKNIHVDYPGKLIGIKFGCKTPIQDIEMIWKMLLPIYGNDIQFSKMFIHENTFSLLEELPNKESNSKEDNIKRVLKSWAKSAQR